MQPRVDSDGDAECLGDLFARGAAFDGRVGMNGVASVALTGHGDSESDQLAGLRVKLPGFCARAAQLAISTKCIGPQLSDFRGFA